MQTQINTHTNVIIFKTNIETEQDLPQAGFPAG